MEIPYNDNVPHDFLTNRKRAPDTLFTKVGPRDGIYEWNYDHSIISEDSYEAAMQYLVVEEQINVMEYWNNPPAARHFWWWLYQVAAYLESPEDPFEDFMEPLET